MKRSEVKKYYRVWITLIKRDLMATLMYRTDFWSDTISTVTWTLVQFAFLGIVFNFTDLLAGWNFWQIIVIFCIQQISFYLIYTFIWPSLREFQDQVRKGDLDWIITKPIDTQFFTGTQRFSFSVVLSFFAIIGLLIYSLYQVPNIITWSGILLGIFLFICSVLITFSILYIFAGLVFIFIRANALNKVYFESNSVGLYPRNLFSGTIKYIFSTFWPMILLFTIPAEAMLGIFDWPWIFTFIGLSMLFIIFSRWFWNFAIKRYSSASS